MVKNRENKSETQLETYLNLIISFVSIQLNGHQNIKDTITEPPTHFSRSNAMKKFIVIVILAVCSLSIAAWAADKDMQKMPRGKQMKKEFIASLNLTDAQKKDLASLKLENEKRGIELRAKAETAKLDLRHLLMADAPDRAGIEKKMAELIKYETDLRMNKIDGWFAANKMLTPDQQKIWIKALRAGTMQAMGGRNKGMHRPMGEQEPPHPDMK